MSQRLPFRIGDTQVDPGQTQDVTFKISEHYCGTPINLPMRIIRAEQPGPCIGVTAAIHGDELNGTGIVRDLILHHHPTLRRGTLVLAPVINMLGFERHSRYMPDRRDLNRCFPGSPTGSLSSRLAHVIFEQLVMQCDAIIDLHSAANFRTNMPNVRTDTSKALNRQMAVAFGCRLIVNSRGPEGSLRRTADAAGKHVILFEAGEPWRIEPEVVEIGVRGILNVLASLEMIEDQTSPSAAHDSAVTTSPASPQQVIAHRARWVRAAEAGLLDTHVKPGDLVQVGQPLATNTSLLGRHWSVLRSPIAGIVMGLTTLPSVKPGDPVCHIAVPDETIEPGAGNQRKAASSGVNN